MSSAIIDSNFFPVDLDQHKHKVFLHFHILVMKSNINYLIMKVFALVWTKIRPSPAILDDRPIKTSNRTTVAPC